MKKLYLTVTFIFIALFFIAPQHAQASKSLKADQVVVYKGNRTLQLLRKGRVMREYRVALGRQPIGHKIHRGDNRTPEGSYTLAWRNPNSKYHLSINVSYPDGIDTEVAESLGLNAGDAIMIHGLPNDRNAQDVGHPYRDWTNGCIAVTNQEIQEIWNLVDDGTPIAIWP